MRSPVRRIAILSGGGPRCPRWMAGGLIALGWLIAHATTAADAPPLRVGSPVPACMLSGASGDRPLQAVAPRSKVLYIDFWASWCAPCAKAFPFLNRLHDELGDRGLSVIGIGVDERTEDARRFLERHPARFTVAQDDRGRCPRAFGLVGMPSSFLVDRDGIVRAIHVGFRDGDGPKRRMEIERLLDEAWHTTQKEEARP